MPADGSIEATRPRLYGLTPEGPRPLPTPEGVVDLHRLFRDLPTGIYEALRTFGGDRLLRLEAHLERADASAEGAGLDRRIDRTVLRRGLAAVLGAEAPRGVDGERRLRFDLCRDEIRWPDGSSTDLLLGVGPLPGLPAGALTRGLCVRTDRALSRSQPTVKSSAWVEIREARTPRPEDGRERPVDETLLLDDQGRILEGSSSNVFLARGGRLHTAGAGVLAGITRGVILDLAAAEGLPVVEERLTVDEALACDEAFLTSASRGPVPITAIDGRAVGDGRPGEICRGLRKAWAELADREARPAWPPPRGAVEGWSC